LLLFDLNTLLTFRTAFCDTHVREVEGRSFIWEGQMSPDSITPGVICEARLEEEGQATDHVHRQRYFSEPEVLSVLGNAGLRRLDVLGEQDGDLQPQLDESSHTKAVYVASTGSV